MNSERLLTMEVMLLLAKYGRKRVMSALAEHLDSTESDIELEFAAVQRPAAPQKQSRPKRKAHADYSAVIDELIEEHPKEADLLRELFTRYENRTFLPELKDVRVFLQRNAELSPGLKSRNQATSHVFAALASMDSSQLRRIIADAEESGHSALGVITDEILRRSG